jgi:hypothetical protein
VPRLLHPCRDNGDTVRVATDTFIRKKMRQVLHIHDPRQDGDLDMCIKFGKVYCLLDASVIGQNIPITDLNVYGSEHNIVHTAFYPKYIPNSLIEQLLNVNGYKCKSERESVRITVYHQQGQPRLNSTYRTPHIQFSIELDQNLRLRYISPQDIRFACLDIISANDSYADVRLIVNSSQKFFPIAGGDGVCGDGVRGDGVSGDGVSGDGVCGDGVRGDGVSGEGLRAEDVSGEGVLRDYMRDDWVLRDDRHGLVINTTNPLHSKLAYASTRKERVYELERPRSLHSALEKRLQVRVQEASDYDEPRDGRFQKVTSRCEVFMHVTTREAIAEVVDSADLVQSLFSLAIRMDPQ